MKQDLINTIINLDGTSKCKSTDKSRYLLLLKMSQPRKWKFFDAILRSPFVIFIRSINISRNKFRGSPWRIVSVQYVFPRWQIIVAHGRPSAFRVAVQQVRSLWGGSVLRRGSVLNHETFHLLWILSRTMKRGRVMHKCTCTQCSWCTSPFIIIRMLTRNLYDTQ